MILLENKELTKEDLYRYRKRYVRFKIVFDLIVMVFALYIFEILHLYQIKEGRSITSTIMLFAFEIICWTVFIIGFFKDFKELFTKEVSFVVQNGKFKYWSSGGRRRHTISYFVDFDIIYTHFYTVKPCIFDGKNVDVHFYINSRNKKEAFLINKVDKNVNEDINQDVNEEIDDQTTEDI